MQSRKQNGRAVTMPVGLICGSAVSVLGTAAGAMIAAKLMDTGRMQQTGIGYAVLVTLLLSSFLGAMVAAKKIKRQLVAVCTLSGVIYLLILLSITALFFGGQYEAVGVTALLVTGGSILAAMVVARPKKGRRRRKTGK